MIDSNIVINGETGGEENKALDAFNYTVQMVKFLTEYLAVMGRSRFGMYDISTLLTEANNCFSTKFNHVSSETLTNEIALEQLRATEYCMNIFPSLYYKTNKNGEKYGN